MISKQYLKENEFLTLKNFFEHIVDLRFNGEEKQLINLIGDMSAPQKKDFIDYLSYLDEDETIQVLMYEIKGMLR
jgi:hypothetical protein